MKILGFILIFSLSVYSWADSSTLILDGGRKAHPTRYLGLSVFSFGFYNNTCTGTLISHQGHVLTARHCLEPTIYRTQYLKSDNIDFFRHERPETGLIVTHNNVEALRDHLTFSFGFDGDFTQGTILSIGPGQLYPRFSTRLDGFLKELHQKYTQEGYSVGADFAIVHVPALVGQSCYKMNTKNPQVGESIHSISFPCHKRDDKDWPQLYSAEILRYALDTESVDYRGHILPIGNFVTNSLGESCNSGSSVLNEKNEIVGILHTAYDNIQGEKKEIHLINLSIPRMLEFLDEKTKSYILTLNQECNLSLP